MDDMDNDELYSCSNCGNEFEDDGDVFDCQACRDEICVDCMDEHERNKCSQREEN